MLDIIKNICVMIGLLILFAFAIGTIGILMLCVLFGNIFGFIFITVLIIALVANLYIYWREEL